MTGPMTFRLTTRGGRRVSIEILPGESMADACRRLSVGLEPVRLDDEILLLHRQSRAAWLAGEEGIALALHRRLRAEHSVELFPAVELPEHVRFTHPVGSVLGRATYGDYLAVYQNCGVGSDLDGNRPTLGRGVCLFPGARVLGETVVGDNVFITAGSIVQNVEVPSNVIVFPSSNGVSWKSTKRSVVERFFSDSNRQGE